MTRGGSRTDRPIKATMPPADRAVFRTIAALADRRIYLSSLDATLAAMIAEVLAALVLSSLVAADARPEYGYAHSFQHFHGPVIGDEREITWMDNRGYRQEDYVAHPQYAFSYGVEDQRTGDYHGQKEQRDGTELFGEYTVKEPDGNIRTVKYRAGKDGFHAEVHNSRRDDQHDGIHHRRDHR